jgi:hypothetical protein
MAEQQRFKKAFSSWRPISSARSGYNMFFAGGLPRRPETRGGVEAVSSGDRGVIETRGSFRVPDAAGAVPRSPISGIAACGA